MLDFKSFPKSETPISCELKTYQMWDTPEPIRSGRLCKSLHGAGRSQ